MSLAVTLEKHALLLSSSDDDEMIGKPSPKSFRSAPSSPFSDQYKDSEEHRKIISKIDWHILPFLWLLYLFSILERVNIGNARIINFENGQGQMERELGMSSNQVCSSCLPIRTKPRIHMHDQYNWAVSVFFIGYILLEVPSNLMLQRYSPSIWLSGITICIGLSATAMSFVRNATQLLVVRFLLGVTQAGLVPGILVYLGTWYRKQELGARMGIFFSAASFSTAIGGLLAYAIAQWPQNGLLSVWRILFLIEGLPYVGLGVLTLWMLPDDPASAHFLSHEEREKYAGFLSRIHAPPLMNPELSQEPKRSSQGLSAFGNPRVYCLMFIFVGLVTPATGLGVFMATLIKGLGFESLQAQFLTCPPSFFAGIAAIAASRSSDHFQDRFWHLVTGSLIACISLIGLNGASETEIWYVLITFAMMGVAASIPILMAWSSEFLLDPKERSVGMALTVAFGNLGGVISGQVYRQEDAPLYRTGHWIMVGSLIWSLIWACLLRLVWTDKTVRCRQGSISSPA
jgi:MFS family permease